MNIDEGKRGKQPIKWCEGGNNKKRNSMGIHRKAIDRYGNVVEVALSNGATQRHMINNPYGQLKLVQKPVKGGFRWYDDKYRNFDGEAVGTAPDYNFGSEEEREAYIAELQAKNAVEQASYAQQHANRMEILTEKVIAQGAQNAKLTEDQMSRLIDSLGASAKGSRAGR